MKPPRFEYADPSTVEEALTLIEGVGEDGKLLAGGQSLVPMMNFRLVRPRLVVDLNRIAALSYVREHDGGLAIGAMTRQWHAEHSPLIATRAPLLQAALALIGHAQIRHRGTIGGSIAHADPAAELPAVAVALDATFVARDARQERVCRAREFFVSHLTTALGPAEILVEVRLPAPKPRTGTAFLELSRRHGDFAIVAVAATVTLDPAGVCMNAALVFSGVGGTPVEAVTAVERLRGERPTPHAIDAAAQAVPAALSPDADIHASAEYRKHVAGVLARRALTVACKRAEELA